VNTWTIRIEPVTEPDAARLLRAYFTEVASRYYGRAATEAEIDAAMAEDPNDDLAVFLVARRDDVPAGCVGLRLLDPGTAELTRMYVWPEDRGNGGGAAMLGAIETAARNLGAQAVRLDTRGDLVEARRLYARHGYVEIPAYNHGRYAEHWFEKKRL
jgi:GNAT superfamily N-acetyltransferase